MAYDDPYATDTTDEDPFLAWINARNDTDQPLGVASPSDAAPSSVVTPAPASAPPAPVPPPPSAPLTPDATTSVAPPAAEPHQQYLSVLGDIANPLRIEGTPSQEGLRTIQDQTAAPASRQRALDEMTPEDEAKAVSSMTPDEFVQYQAAREGRQLAMQAQRQHELAVQDAQRAADNLKAQQDSVAAADAQTKQLAADAARLAATKVNPKQRMQQRSIGGTIADFLALTVGGAFSQYTGGKNLALESLDKSIDDNIAAQKDDIANGWKGIETRKGEIAAEYQRHGDLYRAQETYRVAAYQSAINGLQAEMQQYDPQGATAIRMRNSLDELHARQAAALSAAQNTFVEQNIKLRKAALEERTQAEAARHNRADESIQWAKEAREGKAAKTDQQVWSPQQLGVLNPGLPTPPVPMSQKDYGTWLGTQKQGAEALKAQRENSPEERARQFGVGDIVTEDNKAVLFRDTASAEKVGASKASVDTATQLIDSIVAARRRYGWTSDLVKSDEWRKMQADYGALVLQKKNTDQLGVLSESDMDLIGKSLGTKDPTEVRDPTAGLKQARATMVNSLNATIRAQAAPGQKPKRWEPPKTADLPDAQPLIQGRTNSELGEDAQLGPAGQLFSFSSNEDRRRIAENASGGPSGLDPDDDKRVVAAIRDAAKGKTPEARADAVQRLADAAQSARVTVATGVLSRIQGESPEVYRAVLHAIPPDATITIDGEQMLLHDLIEQNDKARAAVSAALPRIP